MAGGAITRRAQAQVTAGLATLLGLLAPEKERAREDAREGMGVSPAVKGALPAASSAPP
jgi:hypothetical protein